MYVTPDVRLLAFCGPGERDNVYLAGVRWGLRKIITWDLLHGDKRGDFARRVKLPITHHVVI
jgi:hypothetical protein